jgi:hypothetical protein
MTGAPASPGASVNQAWCPPEPILKNFDFHAMVILSVANFQWLEILHFVQDDRKTGFEITCKDFFVRVGRARQRWLKNRDRGALPPEGLFL